MHQAHNMRMLRLLIMMAIASVATLDAAGRGGGRGGGGGGGRGGGGGGRAVRSSPSISRPAPSQPSSRRPTQPSSSRNYNSGSRSATRETRDLGANRGSSARSDFDRGSRPVTPVRSTAGSRHDMPITIPPNASRTPAVGSGTRAGTRTPQSITTIPAVRPSPGNRLDGTPPVVASGPASAARAMRSAPAVTHTRNVPLTRARPSGYGSVSSGSALAAGAAAGLGARAAMAVPGRAGRDVETGTGPGGGEYARVDGPRGGEFGVIRGPGGSEALVGQRADGDGSALVRGPRGNTVVRDLPDNCENINWGGHDYWCHGHYWYAPIWYDDHWYYEYRYPPVNYWYESLPPAYETVVISNETYYYSDAVYYQAGDQAGQEGYVVVPPPATNSVGQALALLQRTCDFLGAVTTLTAEVEVTMDRYLVTGDHVPVSGIRSISIRQPDRLAVDATTDGEAQRLVYDGKTVTMIDPASQRSIGISAPPRLEDLLPDLGKRYGKPMPFGDLLQRNAFDILTLDLVDATYVGTRQLEGQACHHLAFMGELIDWELWVTTGDQPFPLKITITYKEEARTPRFTWLCRAWTVNEPLSDSVFDEEPPPATTSAGG